MVGGHYTYAEVPLGDWAREAFGLDMLLALVGAASALLVLARVHDRQLGRLKP